MRFHEETETFIWRVIDWSVLMLGLCWLFVRLWTTYRFDRRQRRPRRVSIDPAAHSA
jgi:hypothetical protein